MCFALDMFAFANSICLRLDMCRWHADPLRHTSCATSPKRRAPDECRVRGRDKPTYGGRFVNRPYDEVN